MCYGIRHIHEESRQVCRADVESLCDEVDDSWWSLVDHVEPSSSWLVLFFYYLPAIWIPKTQAAVRCDMSPPWAEV